MADCWGRAPERWWVTPWATRAPGAAIGAGVGALSGAAIGHGMDESEARNRALIEAKLGRQVAGAATVSDVVAMSRSGIDEGLIINHIHAHGLAAPLQASDVIYLQQQGVSRNVIAVMQTEPVAVAVQPVYAAPPSGTVIIEERTALLSPLPALLLLGLGPK